MMDEQQRQDLNRELAKKRFEELGYGMFSIPTDADHFERIARRKQGGFNDPNVANWSYGAATTQPSTDGLNRPEQPEQASTVQPTSDAVTILEVKK
jgi:hypothetical protein